VARDETELFTRFQLCDRVGRRQTGRQRRDTDGRQCDDEPNIILSLIKHHVALMGFASNTRAAMEAAYALAQRAVRLDDRNE